MIDPRLYGVARMRKIDGEWHTIAAPARAQFAAMIAAALGCGDPRPGKTITLPRRQGGRTHVRYRVEAFDAGTQTVYAVILAR